jgi:hypothetical protein
MGSVTHAYRWGDKIIGGYAYPTFNQTPPAVPDFLFLVWMDI